MQARVAGALLVIGVVLLGSAAPASAHAQLERSTPSDGTTLTTSPKSVEIVFNEAVTVSLGGVRVFDSEGHRVDDGNSRHAGSGDKVTVGLSKGLANGTYIVTWRVISADSHPVHGGFLFSVRAKSKVASGLVNSLLNTSGDKEWQIVGAFLRIVAYAGILLASGGAVLLAIIGDEADHRRLVPAFTVAAGLGALAVLLGLPVQATLATGLGIAAITKSGVLSQVISDGIGTSLLAALVGSGLLIFQLRRPTANRTRPLTFAAAALAAGSFALAGHSRVTAPTWLTTTADLSHLFAGSIWLGGVVVLAVVLGHRRSEDDPSAAAIAVDRFSSIATIALTVVSVAGFTLGWFEVRALRALTSTTYGRLLLVKVAVVALVALAGAYNHYRLVPLVHKLDGHDARWTILRRSLRAETVGLVVVLALTGVLVNVTPAKTAAGIGTVSSVSAKLGTGSVNLTIDPNRAGTNSVHIYLLDSVGRQVDVAKSLELEFSQPSKDIGPIERQPVKAGPGHWQYDGDVLSIPGEWEIAVNARVSEFDMEQAQVELRVNP